MARPRGRHWDTVYETKSPDQVSWFQSEPALSLELIDGLRLARSRPIIDVGGGASTLIVATYAADGPDHCSGLPVAGYDPRQLAEQFDGFTTEDARCEDHYTPTGAHQPFTYLLMRRPGS